MNKTKQQKKHKKLPESVWETYKPKFRHFEDNFTNARRLREIMRKVAPCVCPECGNFIKH